MVKVVGPPTVGSAGLAETVTVGRTRRRQRRSPFFPATLAVTVASRLVVSVVTALPLRSVLADVALNDPAVLENVTGTPCTALPEVSVTVAVITLGPPLAATLVGLAFRLTAFAAAAPTVSSNASEAAPPEIALIAAVPDWPLATNRAVATPLSVRASAGDSAPRFVVNVTVVPF